MKKIVIKAIALVCLSSISLNSPILYATEGISTYSTGDVYNEGFFFSENDAKLANEKYKRAKFYGKVNFAPEVTNAEKFAYSMFDRSEFYDVVTIPSTFETVQLNKYASNNTESGIFNYVTFYNDVVIEEGVKIINSQTFRGAKFKEGYLRLPDSITQLDGGAIMFSNLSTISLGPNIESFECLWLKSLKKIEFREGNKDFYVFNGLYLKDGSSVTLGAEGEVALYMPRSFNPYSDTFFREVNKSKDSWTMPEDLVEMFNLKKGKYNLMPYVWEGSLMQQYFDENGVTYTLRDASNPEDPSNIPLPGSEESEEDVDSGDGDLDKEENEDGENNGDDSQKPGQTPGSDGSGNGNVSGDTIIVDGNIFESEEEVKVVPATPGLKRVGPTLEVYKALLKEVDSSANNRSLRRVSNFINRFGSSFSLLFRR